nr:unnamed protein product [Haemonchus contortus]
MPDGSSEEGTESPIESQKPLSWHALSFYGQVLETVPQAQLRTTEGAPKKSERSLLTSETEERTVKQHCRANFHSELLFVQQLLSYRPLPPLALLKERCMAKIDY